MTSRVNRAVAVLVLALLMAGVRWAPLSRLADLEHQATLGLGFILVFGFLFGHFTRGLSLPGITGYLLAGVFCGPFVAGFLTPAVVDRLQFIDDLALALIAFTAGGELRLASVRPRLRSILWISLLQIAFVFFGVTLVLALILHFFPLLSSPGISAVAVALVFGLIAVANSPATTVAVINEMRARGPFTDTVLGVTVFKDVAVLVLFTLTLPVIRLIAAPETHLQFRFIGDLAMELGVSLIGGVILGGLVTLYMRGVGAILPVFVVGISLLVTQVTHQFHIEPLLLCMVAGFVIENVTEMGDRFIDAIERSSLPVYVVFFAIAGASLDLAAVRATWLVTTMLVLLRILLTSLSTRAGERVSEGGNRHVRAHGWMGFVAQAGVTLGMASIVARKFPAWGPEVRTIALAMIAVNQLLGPVGFRWALVRSGEAGKRGRVDRPQGKRREGRTPEETGGSAV